MSNSAHSDDLYCSSVKATNKCLAWRGAVGILCRKVCTESLCCTINIEHLSSSWKLHCRFAVFSKKKHIYCNPLELFDFLFHIHFLQGSSGYILTKMTAVCQIFTHSATCNSYICTVSLCGTNWYCHNSISPYSCNWQHRFCAEKSTLVISLAEITSVDAGSLKISENDSIMWASKKDSCILLK